MHVDVTANLNSDRLSSEPTLGNTATSWCYGPQFLMEKWWNWWVKGHLQFCIMSRVLAPLLQAKLVGVCLPSPRNLKGGNRSSFWPPCKVMTVVTIMEATWGGWVILPVDCFGTHSENLHCHVFYTARLCKHVHDKSLYKYGNTIRKKSFVELRDTKIWRCNNFPTSVMAKLCKRQISFSTSLA